MELMTTKKELAFTSCVENNIITGIISSIGDVVIAIKMRFKKDTIKH
jgi:hypothetical protein